jgi:hypothetical protein
LAFRRLFGHCKDAELAALRTSPDDTIALQAAWEEVRRAGRGPQADGGDQGRRSWFLGFLEGRARLRAPAWWRQDLLRWQARRHGRHPYHWAGLDSVYTSRGTALKREGGKVVLVAGGASTVVPKGLLKNGKDGRSYDNVSALVSGRRCYLAAHADLGFPYPLTSFDCASGKTVWQAEVWAVGGWQSLGLISTHPDMAVAVTEQDGRVIVFGSGSFAGSYVEAFRASDGTNLFRFGTVHGAD